MGTLEQLIEKHEGRKNKPYLCPAKKRTIGVGHNMDSSPLPKPIAEYLAEHGEITNEMVDDLLQKDISTAKNSCLFLFPEFNKFSTTRQNAFIDFLFNVGLGTARKFNRTVHAANIGHWDTAANEMQDSAWFRQVGLRGPEIVDMIREG